AGDRGYVEASASGALAFALLLDNGAEVAVEPVGASAVLAVRSGIEVEREVSADGRSAIRPLGVPGPIGRQGGSRVTRWSRVVAWVALGDAVTVEGRLLRGAPFRGRRCLAATRIRVPGGTLEALCLAPGDEEPLDDSSSTSRSD